MGQRETEGRIETASSSNLVLDVFDRHLVRGLNDGCGTVDAYEGSQHTYEGLQHTYEGLEHAYEGLEHAYEGLQDANEVKGLL